MNVQPNPPLTCLAASLLGIALLAGCAQPLRVDAQRLSQFYTAVGYATTAAYKDYPPSQRRLLAIRAARLDAYRNLVEALCGMRIRGRTHMTHAEVESDSSRSYVDVLMRGARLKSLTPKPDGVYQVAVELLPTPLLLDYLHVPPGACVTAWPAAELPQSALYPEVFTSTE